MPVLPGPSSGRGPDWATLIINGAPPCASAGGTAGSDGAAPPRLAGLAGLRRAGLAAGLLGWGPLRLPAQLGFRHPPPYGIPLSFSIAGSRTPPCSVHARPRFGDGSRPDPGFGTATPRRSIVSCTWLDYHSLLSSPLPPPPPSPCRVPMGAAIPACPLACDARSHHRTTRPTSHPRPSHNTRLHTPLTPTSINNNTSSTRNTRSTRNTPNTPNTRSTPNTRRRANTPTTSSPRPRRRSTTSPASRMPPDPRCPRCRAPASALRRRARCSSSPPRSATSSSP